MESRTGTEWGIHMHESSVAQTLPAAISTLLSIKADSPFGREGRVLVASGSDVITASSCLLVCLSVHVRLRLHACIHVK